MFVSETYSLEDCHYYNGTQYTGGSTYNLVNLNIPLPSDDYTIEFDTYQNNSDSSGHNAILRFGSNANNFVWAGITVDTTYKLQTYQSGRYVEQLASTSTHPAQEWVTQTVTISDGTVSFKDLTSTYTRTFSITTLLLLLIQNGYLKNIKVKPL